MALYQCFNESYERCQLRSNFFTQFYDNFWSKGEGFREKFTGVDIEHQIRMLKGSIVFVMMANFSEDAQAMMQRYGEKHGPQGIDVSPDEIDIWFESLIETVAECDPLFSSEVEQAWRDCFGLGLSIMKQQCRNKTKEYSD